MKIFEIQDIRFDCLEPVIVKATSEVKAKIKYFNGSSSRALLEGDYLEVTKKKISNFNLKLLLENKKCVIGINEKEKYKKITKGLKVKFQKKEITCNDKKENVLYILLED